MKRTVGKKPTQASKRGGAPIKQSRVPANRALLTKKLMIAAQRQLNAQKPVVISQTRRIGTNDEWANALVIERNPGWVSPPSGASYVWGESDPNGPAAVVARRFQINDDIESASLFLAVDNYAIVLINGREVVNDAPQANESFFNPGRTFNIRRFLRRGTNDIVIVAFNFPSNENRSANNPAGVAARLVIELD
jgi:hypothetical protein